MKQLFQSKNTLIASLLAFGSLAGGADAAVLRTVNSENPFTNGSWAFGTIFTVGASDLNVTALGAYDRDADGFSTGGGIKVGVFNETTQLLIGSTNVLSSDPITDLFRYSNTAISLQAGQQYRLVAVSGSDEYNNNGSWSYNESDLTIDRFGYSSSNNLIIGDNFQESDYGMGNMQFSIGETSVIPEPSSPIVFGTIGVLSLGMRSRRSL